MNISLALSTLLNIVKDGTPKQQFRNLRDKTNVGAGFYALQKNTSRSGLSYTKLVKRDKSNILNKRDPRYMK